MWWVGIVESKSILNEIKEGRMPKLSKGFVFSQTLSILTGVAQNQ